MYNKINKVQRIFFLDFIENVVRQCQTIIFMGGKK